MAIFINNNLNKPIMKKQITIGILEILLVIFSFKTAHAQMCTASFISANGSNGAVSFTSTSALTTSLTTYYWSFGNGTTFTATGNAGMLASTTFSANGIYTVSLFIYSAAPTCSSGISQTISVTNLSNTLCTLNAAEFMTSTFTSNVMQMNNISTGTISTTSYSWNFGDGTGSTLFAPAHAYSNPGIYTITLVATNNATCVSTATDLINMCGGSSTIASISYSFNSSTNILNCFASVTGTNAASTYSWNVNPNGVPGNYTASVLNPSFAIPNGTYQIVFFCKTNGNVSNTCLISAGGGGWYVFTGSTTPCNLTANFNSSNGSGGLVNFNNTSTGTSSITTYQWNFGNGSTSTLTNPSNTYTASGIYTVTLVASTGTCNSTKSNTLSVNINTCVANSNFSLAPSGTAQLWFAIPANSVNISAAQWSWGDGSTSNTLFTSHQYSAAGFYSICLSVTVNCGSSSQSCSTYSIYKGAGSSEGFITVNVIQEGTVGMKEISNSLNQKISVYPNPSSGKFVIELEKELNSETTITISNLIGEIVYTSLLKNKSTQIELNQVPTGIYLVKLQNQEGSSLSRIMIQK
jgi:PKD repeat protein